MKAEIIAIGDELVSGQRLDTNSQWISSRLSELGIEPLFHSTVGDDLESGVEIVRLASNRSDVVVTTGGIGPTKDDLTRQILATVAKLELEYHAEVESHIRNLFRTYGRDMPENNRMQAFFPAGSIIIPNREGTAPGIDLSINGCRFFSLPGVPYEMKEMWQNDVATKIFELVHVNRVIRSHTVHCFGAGESQIELLLDGMTDRDHVPRVGITASQATISLRITAIGSDEQVCQRQILETKRRIDEHLGELVFGCNGETLPTVVLRELLNSNSTLSIFDYGFGGAVGLSLASLDQADKALVASHSLPRRGNDKSLDLESDSFPMDRMADLELFISGIQRKDENLFFEVVLRSAAKTVRETFRYTGHSELRESRTVKLVLNLIRLNLSSLLE